MWESSLYHFSFQQKRISRWRMCRWADTLQKLLFTPILLIAVLRKTYWSFYESLFMYITLVSSLYLQYLRALHNLLCCHSTVSLLFKNSLNYEPCAFGRVLSNLSLSQTWITSLKDFRTQRHELKKPSRNYYLLMDMSVCSTGVSLLNSVLPKTKN
jgi:hypothetical protein